MDITVISMPKSKGSTTILFEDGDSQSIQISTIQSAINRRDTRIFKFDNSTIFDNEEQIATSTPYPKINGSAKRKSSAANHLKVLKNPLEQSILKNSQRRKSKNFESVRQKRKVFFVSPEIMEIPSIDEKMKKSFIAEKKLLPKGTPIRHPSKIRPRLLNFTESATKLDVKRSSIAKTENHKVKRLTGGKKTSPIQEQNQKPCVSETFLKGVKLNRRFELLMKNLMKSKCQGQ